MFTISFFLGVALFFILILFIFFKVIENNSVNTKRSYRLWYFFGFFLLVLISIFTVNKYVYPKDEKVFKNTDYHILRHKGFKTDSVFYLVKAKYADDFFPRQSLWDSKSGLVRLNPSTIRIEDYYAPFYVEKKKNKGSKSHKNNTFELANKSYDFDVQEDGLLLTHKDNGDTLYHLRIVKGEKGKPFFYISSSSYQRPDTSNFTKAVRFGYPLSDIIVQSPHFEISDELQSLLEGTLLVRESLLIKSNAGEVARDEKAKLLLFPGYELASSDNLLVNGQFVQPSSASVSYSGQTFFFSGMYIASTTEIYSLSCNQDKTLEIRYLLPKMQKLKGEKGRLFITSSIDNVLEDSKDGGYFFNIFDYSDNFNNINAEIRYIPGNSRENLSFEVVDYYSSDPRQKMVVKANDGKDENEFFLSVRSARTPQVKWIFDVLNLRESNSLSYSKIVLFILVFLLAVGLRLSLDALIKPRTLTLLELVAYVVVFCFCVVRLILSWRISTFVPINDITAPVFAKMRSSNYGTTFAVLTIPLVVQLWQWLSTRNDFETALENVKRKFVNTPTLFIIIIFLVICAICALFDKGSWERILHIPVPLLSYILFDLWLLYKEKMKGADVIKGRISLVVFVFVLLAFKDAGFAVFFFVFLFVYHAIVSTLLSGGLIRSLLGDKVYSKMSGKWSLFLLSLVAVALLTLFLIYEGDIMIWCFNHVPLLLFGMSAVSAVLMTMMLVKQKGAGKKNYAPWVYGALTAIIFTLGVIESIPNREHLISEAVNSKIHMKYRAEVQKLREPQKIDDLIERSDFKSNDIVFIMRSAHNQWFINQYLKAGDEINDSYFALQPHSVQGCTYTTQTTDLIITRYVIAEHGKFAILFLLTLLFLLIPAYYMTVNLKDDMKREMMMPILLIFVTGLLVFLSATNRIVFVGQDFPFLSIQSKISVLFPTILLLLSILSTANDKLSDSQRIDPNEMIAKKWLIFCCLSLFAVLSVVLIKRQGKDQKESQFDVSTLISHVSERVSKVDKSFVAYQKRKANHSMTKDDLWHSFVNDKDYSEVWSQHINDPADSTRFYRSLLQYFDSRQLVKSNPDELLHMRKRGKIWHLTVNRKHFFIPSMMESNLPWKGDLMAAKTDQRFSYVSSYTGERKNLQYQEDIKYNILPPGIQSKVHNIQISYFDHSWGDTEAPLILINARQSNDSRQFFHIETSDTTIVGSYSRHQLSTRVKNGDLLLVNKTKGDNEPEEVISLKFVKDNENYLAKNIWMNGSQRLFYPLGKESMWSYQFANAVSNVFGESDYRDSSLRISIDYDLHKKFYKNLSSQNKSKLSLRYSTLKNLVNFEALDFTKKQRVDNGTSFYYDSRSKRVKCKRNGDDINRALRLINERLRREVDLDPDLRISKAIDNVVKREFDFSAVVLDGNGRIRLLFDHTRAADVDPNNIRFFNKFLSDMYKSGSIQSERDIFGNKALQILPSGPGSSFKPIAYTAVTSQEHIAWETLDVLPDYLSIAQTPEKNKNPRDKRQGLFDYYGGVDATRFPLSFGSTSSSGFRHNDYLVQSNNIYHSTVILLGLQQHESLERVFKAAGNDKFAFPVMMYKGARKSFDPNVWYAGHTLHPENGVLNQGLWENFKLGGDKVEFNNRFSNYFGKGVFENIFKNSESFKAWIYPETGSHNVYDRKMAPHIRWAFNQMYLGSYPLEVSPLQMASMGMRLATLNRTADITTLDDKQNTSPEYSFFEVRGWTKDDYFNFYKRQVFSQLRKVPNVGTAKALRQLSTKLANRGYYMYAKTGTLNDDREGANEDSRIKHLLVIISNQDLESLSSVEKLKSLKYYVIYLSYLGIDKDRFSTSKFEQMISDVVDSELFQKYMKEE